MCIWLCPVDSDDGEARRHGLQSVYDRSATLLQQTVITYLHDCEVAKHGKTHTVAADMTEAVEMGASVHQVAQAADAVVKQTTTKEKSLVRLCLMCKHTAIMVLLSGVTKQVLQYDCLYNCILW